MPHTPFYVGRLVVVGTTPAGECFAGYRVSSRSFPNRMAVVGDAQDSVRIVPKPGFETDIQKNPYIAYNCVRVVCGGAVAVATNGSQTDPIAEKIAMGLPPRDALALSLLALDYEKDHLDTPRVCAVADTRDGTGWLAAIRKDGLDVRKMDLSEKGVCYYVSTYETNLVEAAQRETVVADDSNALCTALFSHGIFGAMTNPVTSVAARANGSGFDLAVQDATPAC